MKIGFDFLQKISRCAKFTRESTLVPQLSYLCFSGNTITAYNGFSGIVQIVDEDFGDSVVVPSRMLIKILGSLESELEITLESTKKLLIKGKGIVARLDLVECEAWDWELPSLEEIRPLPSDFMDSIEQVYFTVCSDETKANMRGVFFDGEFVYSTDNIRMSRFPSKFPGSIVVPDSILNLIAGESSPMGYVLKEDGDGGKKLWLRFEDFLVWGREVTGSFPNCREIFSLPPGKELDVNLENLNKTLDLFGSLVSLYPSRVDLIVDPPDLFAHISGLGISEIVRKVCTVNCDDSFLISLNLRFLGEMVSKTEKFFVNDKFIHLISSSGLESILLLLETSDAESILERIRKDISFRG